MNQGDTATTSPDNAQVRPHGEPSFIDDIERIRVRVESPGRNVVATWTPREGLRVTLADGVKRSATEGSLSQEVTSAVRGVARGYTQAFTKLLGSTAADGVVVEGELARRYRRDIEAIEVRNTSPRGYAKADIADGEDITVRLRPGVLASMTPPEALATDIEAVIDQTVSRHHAEIASINRRYRELATAAERKPA